MNITKSQYQQMYKKSTPKSPIWKDCFFAFVSGGLICLLGQGLSDLFMSLGFEKKEAQAWVAVTLVGLGALLTALKIYDVIAKHAGAGTIVPITGFANSIVAPAMEFREEGQVLGTGANMFTIAGPVLVFGIMSSVIYGFFVWFFHMY